MKYRDGLTLAALLYCCAASFAADGAIADRDDPSVINPLAIKTLDQLPAMLARPLFAPSRSRQVRTAQPILRNEQPAPAQAPPPPSAKVLGILKSADITEASLALTATPPKTIRVRLGDQVNGWTVTEISEHHVTLSLDAQKQTLDLFKRFDLHNAKK